MAPENSPSGNATTPNPSDAPNPSATNPEPPNPSASQSEPNPEPKARPPKPSVKAATTGTDLRGTPWTRAKKPPPDYVFDAKSKTLQFKRGPRPKYKQPDAPKGPDASDPKPEVKGPSALERIADYFAERMAQDPTAMIKTAREIEPHLHPHLELLFAGPLGKPDYGAVQVSQTTRQRVVEKPTKVIEDGVAVERVLVTVVSEHTQPSTVRAHTEALMADVCAWFGFAWLMHPLMTVVGNVAVLAFTGYAIAKKSVHVPIRTTLPGMPPQLAPPIAANDPSPPPAPPPSVSRETLDAHEKYAHPNNDRPPPPTSTNGRKAKPVTP